MTAISPVLPLLLTVGACAGPADGPLQRPYFPGFKLHAVDNLRAALAIVRQWRFDAVLVDADRCAGALIAALPELRWLAAAPIVLLWSELDESRQIETLESGATAIVARLASPRLVAAKLRGLLALEQAAPAAVEIERAAAQHEQAMASLRVGPLQLDPRRSIAEVAGNVIPLTVVEFDLLRLLAGRPGEFIDRARIAGVMRAAPNSDAQDMRTGRRRGADMHVCRLRRKLREASAGNLHIETVYGRGYCLSFKFAPV